MTFSCYGSLRQNFPVSSFSVSAVSGGSISVAGQIGIRVAGKNRAGYNLLSDAIAISYAAGQKIVITLLPGIRASGEDLFEVGIFSGTQASAKLLATWQAREANEVSPRQLPATIEIATDTQLAGQSVALPQATTDSGGCDAAVCAIAPPAYKGDGSLSTPIAYWFANGLTETGAAVRTGSGINLEIAINGQTTTDAGASYTDVFASQKVLVLSLLGYVRRLTGELIQVGDGSRFVWDGSAIALPQDLEPGYALAISVSLQFTSLNIQVPLGAQMSIELYEVGLFGTQQPSGYFTGDAILPFGQRMRILPERAGAFRRLGGVAMVKGWQTPEVGEAIFSGLVADTAAQRLAISGALGGDIRVLKAGESPKDTEAIRVIASTASGLAEVSQWSGSLVRSAAGGVQVTISYPVDSAGVKAVIRPDYPDPIAQTSGTFNAPYIKLFVLLGGVIYSLPAPMAVVLPSQTFILDSLNGATQIATLPSPPSPNFGLFGYGAIALTAVADGTGTIPAGALQVAITYYFPPGNLEITSINHLDAQCILELQGTIADLFKQPSNDDAFIYSLVFGG